MCGVQGVRVRDWSENAKPEKGKAYVQVYMVDTGR